MNLYTAIYRINKIFPRLAKRLADYFFPIAPWEDEHDLDDSNWAAPLDDVTRFLASGIYNDPIAPGEVVTLYDPCHCNDLKLDVIHNNTHEESTT